MCGFSAQIGLNAGGMILMCNEHSGEKRILKVFSKFENLLLMWNRSLPRKSGNQLEFYFNSGKNITMTFLHLDAVHAETESLENICRIRPRLMNSIIWSKRLMLKINQCYRSRTLPEDSDAFLKTLLNKRFIQNHKYP